MIRIAAITPLPPSVVSCDLDYGQSVDIDILRFLETDDFRGVLAPLRDPHEFTKVVVGPRGRSIQRLGDIDLCADALHRWAFAAGASTSNRPA